MDKDGEDRLLTASIEDKMRACLRNGIPTYTSFLDERQRALAQGFLHKNGWTSFLFYGGYENASRTILGLFPEGWEPDLEDYPISAVAFQYRKADRLTHRDFLGALMSLQLKRSVIGDILPGEGETVVFAARTVQELLLTQIEKVGAAGVKASLAGKREFHREESFDEIRGTVASLRLDCVLALAVRQSREKVSGIIRSLGVELNYVKVCSPSVVLSPGDVFSLKGYGKFVLRNAGEPTRKGRIPIHVDQYK